MLPTYSAMLKKVENFILEPVGSISQKKFQKKVGQKCMDMYGKLQVRVSVTLDFCNFDFFEILTFPT